ncbi:MAG: alpha-amylase family glycosyl hydrolase [Sediminibacterium sp.]|jgi:glycosidase
MRNKWNSLVLFFALLLTFHMQGNSQNELAVYPTHWWTGFKDTQLNLIIRGNSVGSFSSVITSYPGVQIKNVRKVKSNNYLLVDLQIGPQAKPGQIEFSLRAANRTPVTFRYELKKRSTENGKSRVRGVNASDFIYLIMTDRFSNGDPSNDIVKSYRDTTSNRSDKFSRHGGDLKGVENQLSYLNELGVTTLWLTPVNENDMPLMSEWGNKVAGYHGYWFTDHFQVDKRFGGNDAYQNLCKTAHSRGMKIIQDAIYNHIGSYHWIALDPPEDDWLNSSQGKNSPHHREEVFFDPYAAEQDKRQMLDGWFTPHLPDLNQRNRDVARFLIQYSIWATEEYGVDGWRVDTYKYNEEAFLNEINTCLLREFPSLTVFGESWVTSPLANAYFTRNNVKTPFAHNAEGMLDFQNCFAMISAAKEEAGWSTGVIKLYLTLAQDVLYADPMKNCIFLDNHDMDRVYSVLGEDWSKMRMVYNWLFTLRGMPQLYYGTEVLMKNFKVNTDATVREDFPGGWPNDTPGKNLFLKENRNVIQQSSFEYVSKLANFRKSSSALTQGRLMQYIPQSGVYVYFRYSAQQTIMVITNTGKEIISPNWNHYSERVKGYTKLHDVITGNVTTMNNFQVKPGESFVMELLK